MPYLTSINAHQYIGMKLDANRRVFHYYPLIVGQYPSGKFYYQDRNGVCMQVPEPNDMFVRVYFDTATPKDEGGGE